MLIVFHCSNLCTKAPQRYVIRTLPVSAAKRLSKFSHFPSSGICHLVVWLLDGAVLEEPVPHLSLMIFLRSIDNSYQTLRCLQSESHTLHLYLSDDLRSCLIFTSFSFCLLIY